MSATTRAPASAKRPQLARPAASMQKPAAQATVNVITDRQPAVLNPEQRSALIAQAAYFRAESRGFVAGHELEDWLDAERDLEAMMTQGAPETWTI